MAVTLKITPTRFQASGTKLDSAKRYMRKEAVSPDLKFVITPNMDVSGGGLRYVDDDGNNIDDTSYNGGFVGSAGVGIKV